MEDAEQEIRRKREKGRTAQAAFRKRQDKRAKDVKDELQRLREALGAVVSVARADDRDELVSTIKQAAKAAGIGASHLESTPVAPEPSQGDDPEPQNCEVVRSDAGCEKIADSLFHSRDYTRLSGATSYNLWLDPLHYIRINTPPEDIVPYLGAGRYTLAGQLFWSVMEHGLALCQHLHHPETFDNALAKLSRLMVHSKALHELPFSYVKAMAEARLEYGKLGYMSADYASAGERESGLALKRMIDEDYLSRGKDTSVWLTPTALERRARMILGVDGFMKLETAWRSADGTRANKSISATMTKLMDDFVCFGDGPRWNVKVVDNVFSEWVMMASR
ncbi:hypothetical protein BJ170DRAFT_73756 [Xylariales sp. AK1849]|nr:hypothetical protein BJ170DRAFT_73756 [Xylariales sp. AK1849]